MSIKKRSTEEVIECFQKVHGKDHYDYSLVVYEDVFKPVEIICNIHHIHFFQTPDHHSRGCNCPECAREIISKKATLTTKQFIEKANKVHGIGRYDYFLVEYVNAKTKVWIICGVCGYKFLQTPSDHLNKRGCRECRKRKVSLFRKIDTETFIIRSINKHGNLYDYSESYYIDAKHKVWIKCNKCSYKFQQYPGKHIAGDGCPHCNISKGELKIEKWLTKNDIKYENQKTFKECKDIKKLPFDFYLPNFNLCIEFDGIQHFKENEFFGKRSFNDCQKHDFIKENFCKDNNIKLLRIGYLDFDNIEKILNDYLST